jgi:hypothetical protein
VILTLYLDVLSCDSSQRTVKPSCISTVLLKASQPLHTPPIKLVVFQRTYQATL